MISLRLLTQEDVQIYREFRLLGLQESPTAFGSSYEQESAQEVSFFEGRIALTDNQWVLGAFAEDVLIGVVGFVRDTGLKTRHRGFIWGMYVHPDWRGQEIGRQLMVDALARTDALEGLRWLRLSVTAINETAEKLYESLGFESYCTEPEVLCVDGIYLDEHQMVRASKARS